MQSGGDASVGKEAQVDSKSSFVGEARRGAVDEADLLGERLGFRLWKSERDETGGEQDQDELKSNR